MQQLIGLTADAGRHLPVDLARPLQRLGIGGRQAKQALFLAQATPDIGIEVRFFPSQRLVHGLDAKEGRLSSNLSRPTDQRVCQLRNHVISDVPAARNLPINFPNQLHL